MFESIEIIEKSFGIQSPVSPTTTWRSPNPTSGTIHLNENDIENYLKNEQKKKNRKNVSYVGAVKKETIIMTKEEEKL